MTRSVWNFVTDFGAGGNQDHGALLTSALATMASLGGGELIIDAGIYPCSTHVALPVIPHSDFQRPLRLIGRCAPPTSDANAPIPSSGYSVLKHTLTSGTPFFGCDPNGRNNIHLELRDLIFETPNNPQVGCLDLRGCNDVIVDRVLVYPGVFDPVLIQQPTNPNAFGIALPKNNNPAFTSCVATVWGHYTGFVLGELLKDGHLEVEACIEGIRTTLSLHANQIAFAGLYQCRFGIVGAGGRTPLQIGLLDIEHASSGVPAWMAFDATTKDVTDPNHYMVGSATWWISQDGQNVTQTFVKDGGANFLTHRLGSDQAPSDPPPSTPPSSPPPTPPPAGTVVVQDAFTGSGLLAAHPIAPTNTVNATWQAVEGAFEVANGIARNQAAGGSVPIAWVETLTGNVQLDAILRFLGGPARGQLVCRAIDSQNWLVLDVDTESNTCGIYRVSGGQGTPLATAAVGIPFNVDVPIRLIANGAQLTALVLGQTLTASSTFNQSATKHGLRTGNQGVTFDDFTVTAF